MPPTPAGPVSAPGPELVALADACGVATSYRDWRGRTVAVEVDTVRAALAAMDVPAGDDAQARASLADLDRSGPAAGAAAEPSVARCPVPAQRLWGWAVQLYATRSRASWGMGDLGDLRALVAWAGGHGAGHLVCNPLHARTPAHPVQPSPYFPSSRRFVDPLSVSIDDVAELAALAPDERQRIAGLARQARAGNRSPRIDYDAVWRAKRDALGILHQAPATPERREAYAAWRDERGQALTAFATFCALAERHGGSCQRWPAEVARADRIDLAASAQVDADAVDFHAWVQWIAEEQMARAQDTARATGMPIGIVHDLAVGVDPGGADAWTLAGDLAAGVSVGAPPDAFNERGQDWGVPPLRPDRLRSTGCAPWRDIIAAALRHAGGLRVDHILGCFRLWWIPAGADPAQGTYVRYPAEQLLGVLAEEAGRADAVVIGEDLGTVGDGVREAMDHRGVLGSRVLYFERGEDGFRAPADYDELALATVNTHDLPTAAGWWTDAELKTKARLGLFGADTSVDDEYTRKRGERVELSDRLRIEGLVESDEPDTAELVVGLHRLLSRTPARLVAGSLHDAVGDHDQPNLPGTTDEYPNWRLALAGPGAPRHPVPIEVLTEDPQVHRVQQALSEDRSA